jgi:uncharacterized protein (TIGR02271 family)
MADSRDTNRDGKVSLMEKVKDKLHLGHKDSEFTSAHHTTTATSHTHSHSQAALPIVGAMPMVGVMPLAGAVDSRDLNRDGHISTGERLASGHAHTGGFRETDETRMKLHEEQLAISKREVGAGEVDIHKRVQEERVQQTIPLKREEVTVERRPLHGPADPNARIAAQDEVVRVPLFREEIMTEKRIVPIEEVIVRKKEVTENQTVGATLRSEYVETHQVNQAGAFDARDINRDGHVSMGEKLHTQGDARDTNRDGHVSMGEKLKSQSAFGDARDTNHDGHVSMGEKLNSQNAYGDIRDTNRDGHVSAGEKLKGLAAGKAARG